LRFEKKHKNIPFVFLKFFIAGMNLVDITDNTLQKSSTLGAKYIYSCQTPGKFVLIPIGQTR
jgi:hypothetical protein